MYLGQHSKQQWTARAKIIASLFVIQERAGRQLEKKANHCTITPPQPIYSSVMGKKTPKCFDLKANQIKYKVDAVHMPSALKNALTSFAGFEIENHRVASVFLRKGSCTEEPVGNINSVCCSVFRWDTF